MSWASTLKTVRPALVALWQGANIAGATVISGPTLGTGVQGALTVAFQDDNNPVVAEGVSRPEGWVSTPTREQYSVNCAASVLNGAGNPDAAADAVCDLFDAAGAALAANDTLGGLVMSAAIGDWALSLDQQERGLVATIRFNVDIDAYSVT